MKSSDLKDMTDEPVEQPPEELMLAIKRLEASNQSVTAAIKDSSVNTMRVVAANTLAVMNRPEPAEKQRIMKWRFKVIRGEDGFTDEIIAEAIYG